MLSIPRLSHPPRSLRQVCIRAVIVPSVLALCGLLVGCSDDEGGDLDFSTPSGADATSLPDVSGMELRAQQPFEVTHESALQRYFVANDLIQRRFRELDTLRDGSFINALHESIGDEGSADCGEEGSVTLTAHTETVTSPFTSEEATVAGTRYEFDACSVGAIDEIAAQIGFYLDGTVTVLENEDGLVRLTFGDPFLVSREGAAIGETYEDQRLSNVSVFYTLGRNGNVSSVHGNFTSTTSERLGPISNAGEFNLLGYGGDGEARAFRGAVSHPDESALAGELTQRALRVEIDFQSNDQDDCTAYGRFDLESEVVPLNDDSEMTVRQDTITGADGVYAVIRQPEDFNFALSVTINGDTRDYTSNELRDLREDAEDTCRTEFVGFNLQ